MVHLPGLEPGFTLLGLPTYKDGALTIELEVHTLVGATGFEPATSRTLSERTTKLCYAPKLVEGRGYAPLRSACKADKLLLHQPSIYGGE